MPCVASERVSGGCVRHIIGPLASRREAFATFGRHRPHKFCRYDFTGDIYPRKIPMSCFAHRHVRQVTVWQEPCWTPRDGGRDAAAADKADKADNADKTHLPAQWNGNSVWNNIIWYSLTAVPLRHGRFYGRNGSPGNVRCKIFCFFARYLLPLCVKKGAEGPNIFGF